MLKKPTRLLWHGIKIALIGVQVYLQLCPDNHSAKLKHYTSQQTDIESQHDAGNECKHPYKLWESKNMISMYSLNYIYCILINCRYE